METIEQVEITTREERIVSWYEGLFPAVCGYIQKRGGDFELAKELFQEALVIYYEKYVLIGFLPQKAESAYIMGIVKKLWLRDHKTQRRMEQLGTIDITELKQPSPLIHKLLHLLEASGKRCMDLLQSFYYEGLNMKDLSRKFGYGSERSATVQKYKCLEKVRDEVNQKSLSYEDFLD